VRKWNDLFENESAGRHFGEKVLTLLLALTGILIFAAIIFYK